MNPELQVKMSITAWQRLLLPTMVSVLVLAALFFAWQSVFEFSDFKDRITPQKTDLSNVFDRFEQVEGNKPITGRFEYLQWKGLVYLEQETIRHRYAQANATILARAWTRLMGFTTGMILGIVGAAFILGKLREQQTELKHESEALKISLATSSPGIVLAVLGTTLMSITLLTKYDIDIRDVGVYVSLHSAGQTSNLPDPSSLLSNPKKTIDSERSLEKKQSDPRQGGSP